MTGIIQAVSRSLRTLTDGSLRIQVEVNEVDAQEAFNLFGSPGTPMALARLTQEAAIASAQAETMDYGRQARELRLSRFFFMPDVWEAVGPDKEYLAWLRTQPCAAKRLGGCEGDVVAAHVRRIANGAGMGIKPDYSAIPLCNKHHGIQHNIGESALGGREWVDERRIHYVSEWAWETLKAELGYESWKDVPPGELLAWAETHELERYLPREYKR